MPTCSNGIVDIKPEIEEFIKVNIYNYVSQPPYVTAAKIQNHFAEKYKGKMVGEPLTIQQIQGLVIRTRNGEAKGDAKFTMPPFSTVSDTDSRFFCHIDALVNLTPNSNGQYNRIIAWAHPKLIKDCADGISSYMVCQSTF
jgi:hypothetical protein